MADNVPTNVSPSQIMRSGEGYLEAAEHAASFIPQFQFERAALGDFAGDDETGQKFMDGLWNPTTGQFFDVVGGYVDALKTRAAQVTNTGALFGASDVAASENVGNLHVGR